MFAVLSALLLLAQDPDVDSLIGQLSDESIEVRERASVTLIEKGENAGEQIRKRLASADGEIKVRLELVIKAIDRNRKLAALRPAIRLVSLPAAESPLHSLLTELQRQSGMAMRFENLENALVRVQVTDMTPLQALGALCKAAGLSFTVELLDCAERPSEEGMGLPPVVTGSPTIRLLAGGYPESPRVFVRHYTLAPARIETTRWSDFRGGGSGCTLQLHMNWAPETKPAYAKVKVISVTDDKGRSLLEPLPPGAVRINLQYEGSKGRSWWQAVEMVALTMPEADAKVISSLRGKASVVYFIPEKSLVFDAPAIGAQSREFDSLTAEISEFKVVGETVTHKLTLKGNTKEGNAGGIKGGSEDWRTYMLRLKLADGSIRDYSGQILKTSRDTLALPCTWAGVKSKVAAVELLVDWFWHDDSFDFELKDIPLPK